MSINCSAANNNPTWIQATFFTQWSFKFIEVQIAFNFEYSQSWLEKNELLGTVRTQFQTIKLEFCLCSEFFTQTLALWSLFETIFPR